MIVEDIKKDALQARKDRNAPLKNILITLLGEVEIVGKNAGNRDTNDDEAIRVIKKFIKNINTTLELAPDNPALIKEKEVLSKYIPPQLDDEELDNQIDIMIANYWNEYQTLPKIGNIMKMLNESITIGFDRKLASKLIVEKINDLK